MSRALSLPVVLVGPLGALLACGPSFQAIYEGNARFEHCYALEESPHVSMRDKAACWRDWSERYTYGQTQDRIHYATARYVALSQAPSLPTDEALMMAAPGETPRASTITAPAPTNPFAPPPKVLEPGDAGTAPGDDALDSGADADGAAALEQGGESAVHALPLPAASCSEGCRKAFGACSAACRDGGAGTSARARCHACERAYRGCMRRCFR